LSILAAAVLACGAAASIALAAGGMMMTPQQTIHNLVGTWNCVTHDSMHKTWHETDVSAMYGSWLRIDATYPAQNGQHAGTGVAFFGYDSHRGRWLITSVDTLNDYSTGYSTAHAFNGALWHDAYPADGGTATTHTASANQYSVDSSGPDGHGHTVTSHQVCTRA